MSVMTYEQIALSWEPENKRDHAFNFLAVIVLIALLALGIYASSIRLPKQKRELAAPIPERVAKFISEQPRPKPIPKPKVTHKPLPIPLPILHPKQKVVHKPLTHVQKKARKEAEKSGLLALTKQLSGLVDTPDVDKMVGSRLHRGRGMGKAAGVNDKILTSDSGKGAVNVSQHIHSGSAGTGARLDDDQRRLARQLLASDGQIAPITRKQRGSDNNGKMRGDNLRSEEDVAYVMDEHKSMLHAIYRHARRTHPGLKGKIVLQLTILPSGKVSKVRVVSSELHDSALVQNLIARIRQFDFGARPVQTLTVTIPVEFLPS